MDVKPEEPADEAARALRDAEQAELAGHAEQAVSRYRRVLELFPGVYEVHNNLANLLLALGRPREGLECAQRAHALQPHDPLVNANLGKAWLGLGDPGRAVPHLTLALERHPEAHEFRALLAAALLDSGRGREAAALFQQIEPRVNDNFEVLATMARFYQRARLGADAERCLLRMLALKPREPSTYGALAHLYMEFSQFSKANQVARDGLKLDPDSVVFWNTLANSQASIGQIDQALHSYRKVLELMPTLAAAHSNLLLTMHYVSGTSPQELFEEHLRFGRAHAPPDLATRDFPNSPEPERRLRVGYLSPDIRQHSVSFFLEPLLDHRDRDDFELYCYAAVKAPDAVTQRLKGKFDHFRSVADLPPSQVASAISADRIDILIDLAGHTGTLLAAVLGFKPAPVLATYLGYPDTTGIAAVDYRITDWLADPPGAEAFHVERLVRLPGGFLCFRPPDDLPSVGAPPGATRGYITFGSFNREFKVSRKSFDLWCRILEAVPGSRILMKSIAGGDTATRRYQLGEFERRGVDPSRVELTGFIASQKEHLAMYREIDIALDTFPYHGTTTTLDALLMGVPVITLSGHNHASRVGTSLLARVDIPECIARNEDEYVDKAVSLARDPARIAMLHATLRQQLLASPLCDGTGFTRQFERALRGMWLRWCRSGGAQLTAEQEGVVADLLAVGNPSGQNASDRQG